METFIVNGLAYDIINAKKKEVQVHFPDLNLFGEYEDSWTEIRNLIASHLPSGKIGIPEKVQDSKGVSYTVVAVSGEWHIKYKTYEKAIDKRTTAGYRKINLKNNDVLHYGLESCNATEIILPKTIREIGYHAFEHCEGIKHIKLPASVSKIGIAAFECCKQLKELTFPDGISVIPGSCCWGCFNLSSVSIPNTVKRIESSAFGGTNKLSHVEIPSSVDFIGIDAFRGEIKVTIYNNDGILTVENGAFDKEAKIKYVEGGLSKLFKK